jgi:hypothetical protein
VPAEKVERIEPEKEKTETEKVLVFENYDEGGTNAGRNKRKPRKKKKRNEQDIEMPIYTIEKGNHQRSSRRSKK